MVKRELSVKTKVFNDPPDKQIYEKPLQTRDGGCWGQVGLGLLVLICTSKSNFKDLCSNSQDSQAVICWYAWSEGLLNLFINKYRWHSRWSKNSTGNTVAQDVFGHCTYVPVLERNDKIIQPQDKVKLPDWLFTEFSSKTQNNLT